MTKIGLFTKLIQTLNSLFRSDAGKWGVGVFSVAFAVRLTNLIFLSYNDPSFYFPQVDSLWHHNWAIEIATKNFWGTEAFFRAPLYPYFLALVYNLFGIHIFVAKLIQAVVSSASCVLLYLLARQLFAERTARLASLFIAFYGTLIFYESELLIEWMTIFLDLLMLILIVRKADSTSVRDWLLIGVVGGLSAIARPNVLAVFPIYFVWLLVRKYHFKGLRQRLVAPTAMAVGVFLCILPVTLRNYLVADDPVLISSQGGVNFYLGNNPDADGLTMVMPEIKLDLSVPWSDFVDTTSRYTESVVGHKLNASQVSSFWNGKAFDFIVSHPGAFLKLTGKRIIYLFSGFENSDQADIYRFSDYSPVLGTLVFNHGLKFPFGIIAPLALMGIILSVKERRKLIAMYIFLAGYVPTLVLFLVTARHRLPVVVLLIIFAAHAVAVMYERFFKKDYRRLLPLLACLTALIIALNQTPFDLGYDNPAQFQFQRGMVLDKQGRTSEAIAAYREAVKAAPLAEAYNNLGFALAKTGDRAGALRSYQQAIASRPGYAEALNNLGLLLSENNQLDSAEFYFRQALQADSHLPQAYLNLGDLCAKQNRPDSAEALYRRGIAAGGVFEPLYNNLANLLLNTGREDSAMTCLEQLLRNRPEYAPANVNLANILLSRGMYSQAKGYYLRALATNPGLTTAHFNLAILFMQTGGLDSARICLENVLRLDPQNAQAKQALNKLGRK